MQPITVQTTVNAPMEAVWNCWTQPKHITGWAFADPSWEAPSAENDLRVGGAFKTHMRAKDGSAAFDFTGVYDVVKEYRRIEYTLEDGRHVSITFESTPNGILITETFDPEQENPEEMQRGGWQAFLENFKKHTESYATQAPK